MSKVPAKSQPLRVRRHDPYSKDAYALVGYALAHPDHLFVKVPVPKAVSAASDVMPARIMLGQVHFKASAEGLRGLLAAQCGAQVLAASNVKPKGHHGRVQGGMWNVTVHAPDVAAAIALLEPVHGQFVFVTPTMCAVAGAWVAAGKVRRDPAFPVHKFPVHKFAVHNGKPTSPRKVPGPLQVMVPIKEEPAFVLAAASTTSAPPS